MTTRRYEINAGSFVIEDYVTEGLKELIQERNNNLAEK